MKKVKYNWGWSPFQILEETQKEIAKAQAMWSGAALMITGATFIASNPTYALIASLACGLIDKAIAGFWFEKIETEV